MKNLKRLAAAVVLTFALGLTAFAGETNTPPCSNPGDMQTPPGEMSAPPCSGMSVTLEPEGAPGQTDTPPASAMTVARDFAIDLVGRFMLF
jgi:hypothetical protein